MEGTDPNLNNLLNSVVTTVVVIRTVQDVLSCGFSHTAIMFSGEGSGHAYPMVGCQAL